MTVEQDSVDLAPPEGEEWQPRVAGSREILSIFDEAATNARKAIADARDEAFQESWTLKRGDENAFTAPKGTVLRRFVVEPFDPPPWPAHVFLRLLDAHVPSTYGPSADEPDF